MAILIEGPNSPSRITKRIEGVNLNLVSHHVKKLEAVGLIELARTIEKKGRRPEHIYRAVARPVLTAEDWEQAAPEEKAQINTTILSSISEDTSTSIAHGKFDALPDNHLSRSIVTVDDEGWSRHVEILRRTMYEVLETHKESMQRARESGHQLMPARVVIMQFPMPLPPPGSDAGDIGSQDD